MRCTSVGKFRPNGDRYLETTIHLDCGHEIMYDGEEKDAEKNLHLQGGTVTRAGTTRCRPCTAAYGEAVYKALKSLVPT